MTLDYQQNTRSPFFNWKTFVVLILLISLFITGVKIWNGRYEAGYKAGAGEGAAYKELYSKLEKENKDLKKQHQTDERENSRLNRIVAELETKRGPFSPRIGEAEITELKADLSKEKAEIDRIRSEEAEKSRELGERLGKAQRDEAQVTQLSETLKNKSKELVGSIALNFVLGLTTCILLGYIFLKAYGVITPANNAASFASNPEIAVSSLEDIKPAKSLKSNKDDAPKALKANE